jgi:two-component system chemotaxis sensor kinase CheA
MGDVGDKVRDDFLSEAQEIIEGLSRDMLKLDAGARAGAPDAALVNDVFRGMHTLKGLAGLFSATRIGALSHELESLLDDLRLGRLEVTAAVLDVLFRAVEVFGRMLAAEKAGTPGGDELEAFMLALNALGAPRAAASAPVAYELDPGMLAVLTEYEEHRLRTAIGRGLQLLRLRVVFDLSTIDQGLEDLKALLQTHGEILTYLPTGGAADAEAIELDVLLASAEAAPAIQRVLEPLRAVVAEIPRRESVTVPPPALEGATPLSSVPAQTSLAEGPSGPLRPPSARLHKPQPAPEAPLAREPETSLRSVAQTVRVDIQKLDHLMSLLGELSLLKNTLGRLAERVGALPEQREVALELHRVHHSFERRLGALQEGILEVRMVPLGQVFDKLARVVRQASRELDKEASLVITGAETEVDKLIVEELSDPLMHMVRNALDHGIEPRVRREQVGKPAVGTIALNAYQKGSQVVIEVEDDGAGIDPEALVKVAVRAGVVSAPEARELSRRDALGLLFLPGVTTRTDVGLMSGRGVGMDVVKTNIARLGGVVDVQSEQGIGSKFSILMPVTLAVVSALLVRVGGAVYAAPLSNVQEAVVMEAGAVHLVEGREIVTLRGESLPICRLDATFRLASGRESGPRAGRLMMFVANVASRRCGFVVDDILGRQDIVLKALEGPVKKARGFAGATELGDERVGLVLDVPTLLEEALASPVSGRAAGLVGHG